MKKISILLIVLFFSTTKTMDDATAAKLAREAKKEYRTCPYRCAAYHYQRSGTKDPRLWEQCKRECYQEYRETIAEIIKASAAQGKR